MAYTKESTAYLVAGRTLDGRFSQDAFDELCSRIDELAGGLNQQLVVFPAGDFTAETGIKISQAPLNCVIGVLASYAGTRPRVLDYEKLVGALASAWDLPWTTIASLIPDGDATGARLGDDLGMYATACGPLAGVFVGYGVLADLRGDSDDDFFDEEDDARFLADEDGVAAMVPGLDLVRGNTMDQEPQFRAVYGVQVAKALCDGPIPVPVDLSEAAHQDRITRLGPLVDRSHYYLIGHYD